VTATTPSTQKVWGRSTSHVSANFFVRFGFWNVARHRRVAM
jgi:hypothetical protein